MIARWFNAYGLRNSVPVWHLHEKLERLSYLARAYPRVALGSSGAFATVGSPQWWARMDEVRPVVTDEQGRPTVRLHGLRMLNPSIFGRIPLASADSCNVALNIGVDKKWTGAYPPVTAGQRAQVLAERVEMSPSARSWAPCASQQEAFSLSLT
jgi:hypothetical protein